MFDWAKSNILGMNFVFLTNGEYDAIQTKMESRYSRTVVLNGTRTFHCFIPVSEGIVKTKTYSTDEEHYIRRVVKLKSQLETGTKLLNIKTMT